jgi:hypothetical protein
MLIDEGGYKICARVTGYGTIIKIIIKNIYNSINI